MTMGFEVKCEGEGGRALHAIACSQDEVYDSASILHQIFSGRVEFYEH